jgi:chemotaxis signal transduction protein
MSAAAEQPQVVAAATPRSDYCLFVRGGQRFALSTTVAKEILEARPFTPVPYAPPELLGAFNLRGEVIPLVNLDRFLEVEERAPARGDTLVLLCQGELTMAAVVDQVLIVKHVSPWEIRRAKLDPSVTNPLVRGLVGRDDEQAMVLDADRLIAGVVERIAAGLRGSRTKGTTAVSLRGAAPGGADAGASGAVAPEREVVLATGVAGSTTSDVAGPQGSAVGEDPSVGSATGEDSSVGGR